MRRHRHTGSSLVEFALTLPLLVALVIGGSCLFLRIMYRNALDTAAEQAAWAAARTGGDRAAVIGAVQRALPFADPSTIAVDATSTGYHAEVQVRVTYTGDAITSLPFFNDPLPAGAASATNQQERAFALRLHGDGAASARPATSDSTRPLRYGSAAWPPAPTAMGGTP